MQDVVPVASPRLVEGELLSFKGFWFKLHFTKRPDVFAIQRLGPTDHNKKLAKRTIRWRQQHPNAQ